MVAASVRPVDPVSTLEPGLGLAFDAPIARALARNPSQRPTAAELGSMLAAALERWRATPASVGANDQTTLTRVPLPANVLAATPERSTPRRGGGGWLLVVVGALLLALLLGLAAYALFGSGGSGPSASSSATASVGGSASASASATASATPDPFADARAASKAMRAAIDAVKGPDGLSGREAKDLDSLLDKFDRALDADDPKAARDAADKVAAQVTELIDHKAVDEKGAARLRTAADDLVAAANALQD